jgi:GWxTD domain-containing protein
MLAVLALIWLFAAAPTAETKGPTLAKWYEGPVRYILTRREEKEFKALKDDASRSEFIRAFWKRRDPVPATGENEARISFWRRVVEANKQFEDSSTPGWKTDRGKIYILIGPPNDIQEDTNYDARDPTIAARGLVRWIYNGSIEIPSIGGTFIVPFVRGNDGGYHMIASAKLSSPAFDPLANYDGDQSQLARIQSDLDYGPNDLGTMMDQGLLQSPPWQEKDFIDKVTSEEYLGALPMQVAFDFLRAADGSTFALITCGVPMSAFTVLEPGTPQAPGVSVVARLSPSAGGDAIDVGEAAFYPAPGNNAAKGEDLLLYQARVPLRPGKYDLYIGLFERIRLQAANLRSTIDVPDFSGPLSLSSIAIGRSIRPLPEGAGGYNRPFRISDFEFIPALGGTYKSGQTFATLYQIYTSGPAGAGSGLQATSRFFLQAEGGERPVGKPQVLDDAQAVQGFSVELKGWPIGAYRFEVTVKDKEGRTATRSVGFRIQ